MDPLTHYYSASDMAAQCLVCGGLLGGVWKRKLIPLMMDGNIERLEREEREAAEAQWWLDQMGVRHERTIEPRLRPRRALVRRDLLRTLRAYVRGLLLNPNGTEGA